MSAPSNAGNSVSQIARRAHSRNPCVTQPDRGLDGMAEAFVKTTKRDYVYVGDLPDAKTVLDLLPAWFDDYNEHKGIKMLSPRQFRRLHTN